MTMYLDKLFSKGFDQTFFVFLKHSIWQHTNVRSAIAATTLC